MALSHSSVVSAVQSGEPHGCRHQHDDGRKAVAFVLQNSRGFSTVRCDASGRNVSLEALILASRVWFSNASNSHSSAVAFAVVSKDICRNMDISKLLTPSNCQRLQDIDLRRGCELWSTTGSIDAAVQNLSGQTVKEHA